MNVNTVYRFLVLMLAALAAFPASAQNWTFDVPRGWTVTWEPDEQDKSMPPAAVVVSSKEQISAKLTVRQGPKVAEFSPANIELVIGAMAEAGVPHSREGRVDVRAFGPGSAGRYARLTDKDSKAEFRYMNYAVLRKDLTVMLAVVLSNDDDAAVLPKLFKAMDSFVMGGKPSTAPAVPVANSAAKAKAPAVAQDIAWGAIATDLNKGETDPYYGIGGGDTQVEAETNALKFCREAGAKRCTLRLAYTQCGAYALSDVGSGTGMAATKREAEKLALSACKSRGCEIVASDCN